jgi:hypothetical protein
MPISTGIYTCKTCNENFEAKSDAFYSCPCGASEIQPNAIFNSGYTYRNGNTVIVVSAETHYNQDEFIHLSERAQELYDEIKRIKSETGYKYYMHEVTEPGENGEHFLSNVTISIDKSQSSYRSGMNTLKLYLNLCISNSSAVSQNIEERLERFLSLMTQIENGTLDLSKISRMSELAEELGMEESKQQVHEYDYTFHV